MPIRTGRIPRKEYGDQQVVSIQIAVPMKPNENGKISAPSLSLVDRIVGMAVPTDALVYVHHYDPVAGVGLIEVACSDTPANRRFLRAYETVAKDSDDLVTRWETAKLSEANAQALALGISVEEHIRKSRPDIL